MKSILILIITVVTTLGITTIQEPQKLDAKFVGIENDVYIFTDFDGERVEFKTISTEASKKYDLTNPNYIGNQFIIFYSIESETINGKKEFLSATIVDLILPI